MLNIKTLLPIVSVFFIGCGGGEGPTSTTSAKNSSDVLKISQNEILDAINQARSEARDCQDGLGIVGPAAPLTWNIDLYASAYEHSSDLAQSDTFSHQGSGTASDITGFNNGNASLYFERIEANGYTEYRAVGENIAGGQESIEEVMEAWLASPLHCQNVMSKEFSEVGVAIVVNDDADYKIYWTQNFGDKK
ncbi:MAG TPA: CAP domain-containing protein [Campylobacterales bacterium]|nr:CAP domain-containing protein [Campylobacterales bacterium]